MPGSSFFYAGMGEMSADYGCRRLFLWGNGEVGVGKWVYEYFCPEIVFSIENTFQKV